MRFFTAHWWFVESPDLSSSNPAVVFDEYAAHLDQIGGHLKGVPSFVLDSCGLHDDGFESIHIDKDVVTIILSEVDDGHPRALRVSGVRRAVVENWDTEEEQDPRHMYANGDDVGYHELDLDLERNALVYSMITRSGTEIELAGYLDTIRFELIDPLPTEQ